MSTQAPRLVSQPGQAPRVQVEIGTDVFEADAVLIEGPERERLWSQAVAVHPILAEHQAQTARQFPIIALADEWGKGAQHVGWSSEAVESIWNRPNLDDADTRGHIQSNEGRHCADSSPKSAQRSTS